jgi:hypothetical protein
LEANQGQAWLVLGWEILKLKAIVVEIALDMTRQINGREYKIYEIIQNLVYVNGNILSQ